MRKKYCFLICPMEAKARERSLLFKAKIVEPALEGTGFKLLDFLDDPRRNQAIRSRIREYVENADLCIADLTDVNANVAFEYGFRLATGHPVFPMREKGKNLAFNFDDYQTDSYDLDQPQESIESIEAFLTRYCFSGNRLLEMTPDRTTQTDRICRYISENDTKRIDILQVSLLAIRDRLFDALSDDCGATVRVLLLAPDAGAIYSAPTQSNYVAYTRWFVQQLPEICQTKGKRCPTVGLWFYAHEPSVAAIIVDDALIQLGWYFRARHLDDPERLLIEGHDQPSILLSGRDDEPDFGVRQGWTRTFEKTRRHFNAVLRNAELVDVTGPAREEVVDEWKNLKQNAVSLSRYS